MFQVGLIKEKAKHGHLNARNRKPVLDGVEMGLTTYVERYKVKRPNGLSDALMDLFSYDTDRTHIHSLY